ncbi:unnamed protein product, partial [marine sediment metagenome]
MRIYNKYVVSLALSACLINTLLAFFGQNDLGIYFTINIIAYLVSSIKYLAAGPSTWLLS